jgi:hypothetical protein
MSSRAGVFIAFTIAGLNAPQAGVAVSAFPDGGSATKVNGVWSRDAIGSTEEGILDLTLASFGRRFSNELWAHSVVWAGSINAGPISVLEHGVYIPSTAPTDGPVAGAVEESDRVFILLIAIACTVVLMVAMCATRGKVCFGPEREEWEGQSSSKEKKFGADPNAFSAHNKEPIKFGAQQLHMLNSAVGRDDAAAAGAAAAAEVARKALPPYPSMEPSLLPSSSSIGPSSSYNWTTFDNQTGDDFSVPSFNKLQGAAQPKILQMVHLDAAPSGMMHTSNGRHERHTEVISSKPVSLVRSRVLFSSMVPIETTEALQRPPQTRAASPSQASHPPPALPHQFYL